MFAKISILFLLILISIGSFGQSYFFRVNHLDMSDGLSFRDANAIVQDQQGFVWIGTRNGLNKFDGYQFIHYNESGNNGQPAIINNYVHGLGIDNEGIVWVATETGVSLIETSSNQITSISAQEITNEPSKGISDVEITPFTKRIFVKYQDVKSQSAGYAYSEYINDQFVRLTLTVSDTSFSSFANIFEDRSGKLWLRPANVFTFYQIDDSRKVVNQFTLPFSISGLELQASRFLGPDENAEEDILYRQRNELVQIHTAENLAFTGAFSNGFRTVYARFEWKNDELKVKPIELLSESEPNRQICDNQGDIWMQFGRDLVLITEDSCQRVAPDKIEFTSNFVADIYQTKDGTIWVATSFGVYRVLKEKNPFSFGLNVPPNMQGVGQSIRSMTQLSKDEILVAVVHNGLWKYNLKTKKKSQVLDQVVEFNNRKFDILPYGMFYKDQTVWIANWFNDGVLCYDMSTKSLEHIRTESNLDGFARCMTLKNDNELWVGTDRGLNLVKIKEREIQTVQPKNDKSLLKNLNISEVLVSNDGGLWIGTYNDGIYYLSNELEIERFCSQKSGLGSDMILSVHEDENYLWIGTPSGLNKIIKSTKEIQIFTTDHGLPDDNVYAIIADENNLWLTTNKGLCCFDPASESARNYGLQDGLIHEEFNHKAYLKLHDETMLFGGMNGLVSVNPEKLKQEVKNFRMILTRFEKFDDEEGKVMEKEVDMNEGIEIYSQDKFYNFEFALLDLFSSDHIRYAYKLDGYDEDWISLGKENTVRFNKLPPGEYTFMAKGMGRDGYWSNHILSIPIVVHEVFYKTWWFLLLVMTGIIGIIYAFYQYRVRQLKKVEKIRVKIASDLHDDVGSLLTQISIQSELIGQGIYAEEEQTEELNKIAGVSRQAIHTMSDAVWSIDARSEKMVDLLERMKEYAMEFLSRANIEFSFDQNEISNRNQNLKPEFRQNIYLIFKEAINNVVKHSDADKVEVKITSLGKHFFMAIKDNGTLSKNAGKLPGQGLKNMKLRAERINGKIEIDTSKGYQISLTV